MHIYGGLRLTTDTFLYHAIDFETRFLSEFGAQQLAGLSGQRAPEISLYSLALQLQIYMKSCLKLKLTLSLPPQQTHRHTDTPSTADKDVTPLSNCIYLPEIISSYNPYVKRRLFRKNVESRLTR